MKKKPNILWICTDQQRFDTINALGNTYINTPNIDNLVKEGVSFLSAYSQNPICTPSRASFLTGRYPRSTKVRQNGQSHFPESEKLVTRILADSGYKCGLIGKLHLSAAAGRVEERPDDGYSDFQWSHDPFPLWSVDENKYLLWLEEKGHSFNQLYPLKYDDAGEISKGFQNNPVYYGFPAEYHQTTWCTDKASEFIKHNKHEQWLLSLNIFDPHNPFDPPKEYRDRYNVNDMSSPKYQNGELNNKPIFQLIDHSGAYGGTGISYSAMSDSQHREVIAAYYAMIELIDDSIGKVLKTLNETGQRENTLIIFMSDHGEMLGDHGIFCKGPYFYDPAIRVPLIMSYPGNFKKNEKVSSFVELVDIVPTLLELVEISIPANIQGRSLLHYCTAIQDHKQEREYVTCEYYNTLNVHKDCAVYATMLRNDKYKISVFHGMHLGELYDLQCDPYEFNNLWYDIKYRNVKHEMMKLCFDANVFTMDPWPFKIADY